MSFQGYRWQVYTTPNTRKYGRGFLSDGVAVGNGYIPTFNSLEGEPMITIPSIVALVVATACYGYLRRTG